MEMHLKDRASRTRDRWPGTVLWRLRGQRVGCSQPSQGPGTRFSAWDLGPPSPTSVSRTRWSHCLFSVKGSRLACSLPASLCKCDGHPLNGHGGWLFGWIYISLEMGDEDGGRRPTHSVCSHTVSPVPLGSLEALVPWSVDIKTVN